MTDIASGAKSTRSTQTPPNKRETEWQARRTFEGEHRPSVHDDLQALHVHQEGPFRITVTPASIDVRTAKPSRVRLDITNRAAPELKWLIDLYSSMACRKLRIGVVFEKLDKADAPGMRGELWAMHLVIEKPGNDR